MRNFGDKFFSHSKSCEEATQKIRGYPEDCHWGGISLTYILVLSFILLVSGCGDIRLQDFLTSTHIYAVFFLHGDLTLKSSLPSSEESGDALQVDCAVAWSPPSIWLFANRKHKRCTVSSQLPTDVKIKSEPNATCVYRGSGYMLYVRSSVLDSHKTGVYKHVKQRQQIHDPKWPMTIASLVLQWSLPSHQGSFWKALWPFVGGSWHEKKCNWTIDLVKL